MSGRRRRQEETGAVSVDCQSPGHRSACATRCPWKRFWRGGLHRLREKEVSGLVPDRIFAGATAVAVPGGVIPMRETKGGEDTKEKS